MKPVKKNIRRLKRKFDKERRIWSSLSDMRKRQLVETTRKQIDSFLQEQTKMNGQFKQWRKQQKALKKAERLRQKKLRKKQKKKKSKKANDTTMKAIYFLASTPPYWMPCSHSIGENLNIATVIYLTSHVHCSACTRLKVYVSVETSRLKWYLKQFIWQLSKNYEKKCAFWGFTIDFLLSKPWRRHVLTETWLLWFISERDVELSF